LRPLKKIYTATELMNDVRKTSERTGTHVPIDVYRRNLHSGMSHIVESEGKRRKTRGKEENGKREGGKRGEIRRRGGKGRREEGSRKKEEEEAGKDAGKQEKA